MCTSYVSNNTGAVVVSWLLIVPKTKFINVEWEIMLVHQSRYLNTWPNGDITVQQKVIQIIRYVLWPAHLIHHADPSDHYENMHMITSRHTVCIFTPKINLDPELIYDLLSLHAWSACDTTSRPYGI